MATYFIVSTRVIRDALEQNSPLKVRVISQVAQNCADNWEYDRVVCESESRYDLPTLKELAQGCFASDVTVFGCHRSISGEIVLSLDIRLKRDWQY